MRGASSSRALALIAAFASAAINRAMAMAKFAKVDAPKPRGKARSRNTTAQAKRAALKARNRAKHRSHV